MGKLREAISEFRVAAELDPTNRNNLDDLAVTLLFLRRFDEAMAVQRQVIELQPDDLPQVFNLAY